MPLTEWAARWGIPPEALEDLRQALTAADPAPAAPVTAGEAWTQDTVQLEAARLGIRLWRNNVGALPDARGVPVRYGLANESRAQNAVLKSGDLIGIRPVLIGADMVGSVIGQFVSRECKRPGWTYRGTARERAQANWAALVTAAGGDAKFVTGGGGFS